MRFSIVAGALALLGVTRPAAAQVCDSLSTEVFCASVSSESNVITQSDIDTSSSALTDAAWVVDSAIFLPDGGSFTPGDSVGFLAPAIFVTGSGSISITGGAEVTLAANIYLCDSGQLIVDNGTLTLDQAFPFEFFTFAAGTSAITLESAQLNGSTSGDENSIFFGMGSESRLDGEDLLVGNGDFNLNVADEAVGELIDATMLGVVQVAEQGSVQLTRAQYLNMGVTVCDGETTTFAVPTACDLDTNCFLTDHPEVDYVRSENSQIVAEDSRFFAWHAISKAGSSLSVTSVADDANFVVELDELVSPTNVMLPASGNPTGLTDRTVTVGAEPVLAWSAYVYSGADITFTDSNLADLELIQGTGDPPRATVRNSTMQFGELIMRTEGTVVLDNTVVDQAVRVSAGSLSATDSSFSREVSLAGPMWLADSSFTGSVSFTGPAGVLEEVVLDLPAPNSAFEIGQSINATGTVRSSGVTTAATLELLAGNVAEASVAIDATVESADLGTLDTQGLAAGDYVLSLGSDSNPTVASIRPVTLIENSNSNDNDNSNNANDNDNSNNANGNNANGNDNNANDNGHSANNNNANMNMNMNGNGNGNASPDPDATESDPGCSGAPGAPVGAVIVVLCAIRRRRRT